MAINQAASVRGALLVSDLKGRIAQLQSEITSIDNDIANKYTAIQVTGLPATDSDKSYISAKNQDKQDRLSEINLLNAQLVQNSLTNSQTTIIAKAASAKTVTTSNTNTDANASPIAKSSSALEYNVPSVVDAYYSTRASFLTAAGFSNNRPGSVASANELWSGAKSSKGMIVAYVPPAGGNAYQAGTTSQASVGTSGVQYGFQFMYNPATVSMAYSGLPNVDQGFEISGMDKFLLYGTNVTQSTISFQILINRMFDMKYYDSKGKLKSNGAKAYAGKTPSAAAQKQIFNMGTMYDVEYLLRTLLGYTLKSYLRNNQTADMGYLGARPVELHLGKSLRYLGTVTSLGIEHVIFNEQMVPLFTNVQIGFSRLPDYAPAATVAAPKTDDRSPISQGGGFDGGVYDMGDLGVGGGGFMGEERN